MLRRHCRLDMLRILFVLRRNGRFVAAAVAEAVTAALSLALAAALGLALPTALGLAHAAATIVLGDRGNVGLHQRLPLEGQSARDGLQGQMPVAAALGLALAAALGLARAAALGLARAAALGLALAAAVASATSAAASRVPRRGSAVLRHRVEDAKRQAGALQAAKVQEQVL